MTHGFIFTILDCFFLMDFFFLERIRVLIKRTSIKYSLYKRISTNPKKKNLKNFKKKKKIMKKLLI